MCNDKLVVTKNLYISHHSDHCPGARPGTFVNARITDAAIVEKDPLSEFFEVLSKVVITADETKSRF